MHNLITLIYLLCSLFHFNPTVDKILHVNYSLEPIAESEEIKNQLLSQINGISKEFFGTPERELHYLKIDQDEIRIIWEKESGETWMYIYNDQKSLKYKTKIPDDLLGTMGKLMYQGEWVHTKKTQSISNIEGSNSILKIANRELNFCVSKNIQPSLQLSSILAAEGITGLPLKIETMLPQRQGSTSTAKIKISATEINNDFDQSIFDFGQSEYLEKTIKEIERELMMTYMMLLIF